MGGGIIGINIARELKARNPASRVVLLEKEKECGLHASGRNSGVIHAGFYYSPDSLKAKFTRIGNQSLTEYCDNKNIKVNKCGKLVVTKDEFELESLDELIRRGKANEIKLSEVTEKEAKELEPRARTYRRAIYSPTTSSVNPLEVLLSMKQDAQKQGIEIITGVQYLGKSDKHIITSSSKIEAKFVVNAAGLYADKIARDFGYSKNFRIIPFKGLYLYSNEGIGALRTHIYPVPNLKNPFLGVHFTVTVDGKIKIGPTAIPAFWREQYCGMDNFRLSEFMEIIFRQTGLFLSSQFDFKKLAFEETRKYFKTRMVDQAFLVDSGY